MSDKDLKDKLAELAKKKKGGDLPVPPVDSGSEDDSDSVGKYDIEFGKPITTRMSGGADEGAGTSKDIEEGNLSATEIREHLIRLGVSEDLIINNQILLKVYSEMIVEQKQLSSVSEWKSRLVNELNVKATSDLKSYDAITGKTGGGGGGIGDPFMDQLFHFIKLCGLERYNWNQVIRFVVYDESDDYKKLVNKMVYACRYIGFDPAVILKKLIRSYRESLRQPKVSFTIQFEEHGEESSWNYTNQEELSKDMTFLIITFLQRGAVISKISKKSPKDFTGVLKMLVAKYNIRIVDETDRRRRAEALGPEIVTLPRIAACMAQLTTSLYHHGFGRAIANFDEFGDLPSAMFSPMFASVVRKTYVRNEVKENIHPQLVLIAILIDNVLHLRDKVTPLDQIWTYYLAAYQSKVVLDNARVRQCQVFGICDENGYFIDDILDQRERCKRRIKELRPHERIEDFIKEMDSIM